MLFIVAAFIGNVIFTVLNRIKINRVHRAQTTLIADQCRDKGCLVLRSRFGARAEDRESLRKGGI
jgi:hypothetical protein